MRSVSKVSVDNPSASLIDRFNEMADIPILQGRLLENIRIKEGTTTRIPHGLGRKLRGWIVVGNNISGVAASFIYDKQITNKNKDRELLLFLNTGSSSAIYTISLWVF